MRIDLRSPEFINDPHPFYAQLRARRPVCPYQELDGSRAWLVTRHADVQALLRDERLTRRQPSVHEGLTPAQERTVAYLETHLLNRDRPEHTRLRRLMARPLSATAAEALRPQITTRVDALLNRHAPTARMDVIADFAFPLTVGVIGDILGLPEASRVYIRHWYDLEAVTPFVANIEAVIAARRSAPADDLISALAAAADAGEMSETELIGTVLFLYIAGHETTMNAIGNAVLTLLSCADVRRLVMDRPVQLPAILDEILRYEGSVEKAWVRWARQDMTVAGQPIHEGDRLVLAIAAANRDPAVFENPDEVCPAREAPPHLSFGSGPHFCAGAALGRVVLEIAVGRLFRHFPDLALAVPRSELAWVTEDTMRGLTALPVKW